MPDKYDAIIKSIEKGIQRFNGSIPAVQKEALNTLLDELRRVNVRGDGRIAATVKNLKVSASIKAKLNRIILSKRYKSEVREFSKLFDEVTKLQNDYWKTLEVKFKPSSILKEIKFQAVGDVVSKLSEAGIGANISSKIEDILRTNITTGGSYRDMESMLRESLTDTKKSQGSISKYVGQITVDSINQYNAQYTQIVSADLGFEWYAYQGSDIETTRPFCDAMTDIRYFHVSEIPDLLKAKNLTYEKDGSRVSVPIYAATGLPHGMIEGTNAENFFIRRGGYRCRHQIRPVSERLVPEAIKQRVMKTMAYKRYIAIKG